jgi:hypothetical protein
VKPDLNEIVSITTRYRAAQMAANIQANNRLLAMLEGYKPKPPTRWERFTWRVLHYRNRVRDAWLVLIGRKDVCDPCEF